MSESIIKPDVNAIRRRAFLQDMGLGFGSVDLAAMLDRDAPAANPDRS